MQNVKYRLIVMHFCGSLIKMYAFDNKPQELLLGKKYQM